jgi:hypothetical protein
MANLNFPTSPNVDDTYEENGVLYTWDGEKWTANNENGLTEVFVNVDGDTMTGNLTVPSLNGGQLAGFRNQIINGDFSIGQRGNDFFQTAPADTDDPYTLDRWCVSTIASAQPTRVAQQNNDAPPGFAWSIALYANGNPTGGDRQSLIQAIELQRPGNNNQFAVGTTWTLSYWLKSGVDSSIGVGCGFRTSAQDGGANILEVSKTENITTTWTRYSQTFTVTNTASATDACFGVSFYNSVATNTVILIAGVQLEPGPVATPFEHRPIGTELALCQRYYQTGIIGMNQVIVDPPTGANGYAEQPLPVTMRANPTVTYTGTLENDAEGTISLLGISTGKVNILGNFTQSPYQYLGFSAEWQADAEL